MAMEEYAQETVNDFIKDSKTSLDKWKSLSEVVDDFENESSDDFGCNICLDCVQDPVVTLCGHLYCWPCIYKWIHLQNISSEKHNPQCPVCKHDISQKTLVPLYGRGDITKPPSDEKAQDPGMVIPSRPPSPSCGLQTTTTQQQAQPLVPISNVINPRIGMFGEMVYGRIFPNSQAAFYAYPNSYNLAAISTQRARRQATQADRSLGRICFFLFCCIMMCLILF